MIVPSEDAVALRFLADRYGERATPLVPLAAGAWSRAYAFTLDGRRMVARVGQQQEDFCKDQRMGALTTAALPTPLVLEVGSTPVGFFAVAERQDGTHLDDLDARRLMAVLPSLLDTVDAIAALDVADSCGYGIWRADGTGPHTTWPDALVEVADDRPRIPGWRTALERSVRATATFDAGLAVLRRLLPELPDERRYVHADLLHHNVLVAGDRVASVLDWGNALYGDPLYEAAWLLFCWPWYPAWRDVDIRGALEEHWRRTGALPENSETRLLAYQVHIGLSGMATNAYLGRDGDVGQCAALVNALVTRASR